MDTKEVCKMLENVNKPTFFTDYQNLISGIEAITKTKAGFGYTYLELTPLLEIVMPKIIENHFILIQTTRQADGVFTRATEEPAIYEEKDGKVVKSRKIEGICKKHIESPAYVLHSELIHISGEKVECDMPLYVDDIDPQAIGSAETYMRRYSIYALLNIKVMDNDGLDASQRGKSNQKKAESKEPLPEDLNKISTFLSQQEDPKQYYWDIKNHKELDENTKRKIINSIIYPKG